VVVGCNSASGSPCKNLKHKAIITTLNAHF